MTVARQLARVEIEHERAEANLHDGPPYNKPCGNPTARRRTLGRRGRYLTLRMRSFLVAAVAAALAGRRGLRLPVRRPDGALYADQLGSGRADRS